MKCSRCGLISPEFAQRCDCGYDFHTKTVEMAYFTQTLPKDIRTFLIITVAANFVLGILVLMQGDPWRIAMAGLWSVVVYWLYSRLVMKQNWARIALVVLTFPLGLLVGLSNEARLYCLQK